MQEASHKRDRAVWSPSYEVLRLGETEGGGVGARGRGRGSEEPGGNDCGVPVGKTKGKFWMWMVGRLLHRVNALSATELCTCQGPDGQWMFRKRLWWL